MPHQCTDCGRAFEDGSKEMLSGCPDCGGNTFQFKPEGVDTDESGESEEAATPPEPEVNSTVARTVGSAATAVRDLVGGNDSPPGRPNRQSSGDPSLSSRNGSPERDQSSKPSVSGRENSPPATTEQSPASSGADTKRSQRGSDSGSITAEDSGAGSITAEATSREDAAQASARSEVVSPDDLPESTESSVRERPAPVVDESSEQPEREDRPDLDELREQLNEQFESIRVVAPGQYELNLMELYDREEYIIALQEDGKYTIQVPERWGE